MKALFAILLFATMSFGQVAAKPEPKTADKPAVVALTELEQVKTEKQALLIEVASLNSQLADQAKAVAELSKKLADADQQKGQVDANALVGQFFKDHGVNKDEYDFVRNKDTGKWEIVRKSK